MKAIHKKIKKKAWEKIEPAWPKVRDFLLKTGLIWHKPGRQPWHVGWLRVGIHHEDFRRHLHSRGFKDHYIAWLDDGEIFSVRMADGEKHQYHLRVFEDGEVRAHHEISPEESAVKHMLEVDMTHRREHFLQFIGEGWIEFRSDKYHQELMPLWERFIKRRAAKKVKKS